MPESLLSRVTSLAEFARLREKEFADVEAFSQLERKLKEGKIVLEQDALGEILTILRFADETVEDCIPLVKTALTVPEGIDEKEFTIECAEKMYEGDEVYDETDKLMGFRRLKTAYGFGIETPISFFQGIQSSNLASFIDEWYNAQPPEKKWNPSYCPEIEIPGPVVEFCRTNEPRRFLEEFRMYEGRQSIVYPFNGWSLARCLQFTYEKK